MAYLGRQPVLGNFVKLDAISVVNGQAAYTMQNGGVNFTDYTTVNQFLVSLNGTIQAPTSSFTVSGSTLTFASNLSTGDVIDFIIVFGNSLSAGTPTDATVSTAKIVDDAVTAAKINNDIISGSTELATEPADTDEFLVSDAGTLKRIDYSLIKGGSSNAFHAYDMSGGNASGTLVLTSELLDDGSNYNTSNGRYTAPSAGKYHFYCSAVSSTGSDSYINFHLNGSVINGGIDQGGNTPNSNTQGIMIATIDLSANDYITMVSQNSVYNNYIFFGGYKLY